MEQGRSGRDLAFRDAHAYRAVGRRRHRRKGPSLGSGDRGGPEPEASRGGPFRRADRGPGPGRVGQAPLVGSPPGLGRDLGLRNDNRFDLVALPRTAGNVADPAELVLAAASDDSRGDEAQEGERSGMPAKPPRERTLGLSRAHGRPDRARRGFRLVEVPPLGARRGDRKPSPTGGAGVSGRAASHASRFPSPRERNRSSAPKVAGGSTRRSRTFSSDSIQPARRRPSRGRSSIGPGPRSRTRSSSRR